MAVFKLPLLESIAHLWAMLFWTLLAGLFLAYFLFGPDTLIGQTDNLFQQIGFRFGAAILLIAVWFGIARRYNAIFNGVFYSDDYRADLFTSSVVLGVLPSLPWLLVVLLMLFSLLAVLVGGVANAASPLMR